MKLLILFLAQNFYQLLTTHSKFDENVFLMMMRDENCILTVQSIAYIFKSEFQVFRVDEKYSLIHTHTNIHTHEMLTYEKKSEFLLLKVEKPFVDK